MAAERIGSGGAEVIVAGGTESMSMIPMGGHKISPNPWLVDHYPDAYLSMGLTAERVAQRFGITREAADEFSLRSHQKALAAIQAGKFEDETRAGACELHYTERVETQATGNHFQDRRRPARRHLARSLARP